MAMHEPAPIFTIGYGRRSLHEFIELLTRHNVTTLLDVRSRPYSRWQPEFRKQNLEMLLPVSGIEYRFHGDALGGKPDDPTCRRGGHVDYTLIREKTWFQAGLDDLETHAREGRRIAIMCAEQKPEHCHRTWLITPELLERGIDVQHIDETGELLTHDLVTDCRRDPQQAFHFDQ